MGKRIDWYYHRKGWTSCKRSDSYLESVDATVRETVNAAKDRIGADGLEELFDGATKLIVSKGKKFHVYDLKKEPLDGDGLAEVALGPTGNLRAPTIQKGKTFFVGFNEEAYTAHF